MKLQRRAPGTGRGANGWETFEMTGVEYTRLPQPDEYDNLIKILVHLTNDDIKAHVENGSIPNFYNLRVNKKNPGEIRDTDTAMVAELIFAALGSIPEGLAFDNQQDFQVLVGRKIQYFRFRMPGEQYLRFFNQYPLSVTATDQDKELVQAEADDYIAFLTKRSRTSSGGMAGGFAAAGNTINGGFATAANPVAGGFAAAQPQTVVPSNNGQTVPPGTDGMFDDDLPF